MYILIKEVKGKKNRKVKEISKKLPRLSTPRRLFFHLGILTLYFLCMFACFIVIVFIILHKKFTVLILKFNRVN